MVEQYYSQCPRCGAVSGENLRFCRSCGALLSIPPYFLTCPPGPAKRRGKALPLIIGAVLAVIASVAAVIVVTSQNQLRPVPAQVVFGAPLAWRSINWPPDPNMPRTALYTDQPFPMADLAIGDFDGDKDDELYVYCMDSANQVELDGTGKFIQPSDYLLNVQLATWDYDQNGTDELLAISTTGDDQGIYDTQGSMLAHLPGLASPHSAVTGDVDGDGQLDLILLNSSTTEVFAYAPGGKQIWHIPLPPDTFNPAFGDADGDGRAEMILLDHGQLRLSGIGQTDQLIPGWSDWNWPMAVLDLDGDGQGEVFSSNISFLNLATGQSTVLRYGELGQRRSLEPLVWVYLARLPVSPQPVLATVKLNDHNVSSELFLFDTSGACIYEEQLGSLARKYGVAHKADGSDCLVVLTENKLLIYP